MLAERFRELYGEAPAFTVRAPGRVNIIGDHTDYNGGYVMPVAMDRDVRIACSPSDGQRVELFSENFDERFAFDLARTERAAGPPWARYAMAVADALQKSGHTLRGMRAVIKGDVPIGSGLSSSAALEVAVALAFVTASGLKINREKLALLCRRAENDFIGVKCGIMDQFASLFCRRDSALRLDCATLEFENVPLDPEKARVVVFHSGVRRALSETPYNERRLECARAFKLLQRRLKDIETYRDLDVARFRAYEEDLPEVLRRRARHVVTENARVLEAAAALQRGDLVTVGTIMDASHESLRNDFEVSTPELDALVGLAREHSGTYGARLTGAGFGGCVVALVRPDMAERMMRSVCRDYEEQTGRRAEAYLVRPSEGASIE